MIIGTFGDLIFETSSEKVFSLSKLQRSVGKRTAKFTPVIGKESTQYLGPELRKVDATIALNAFLGVKPREALDRLTQLVEGREIYPLIIGGRPLAENPFMLTSASESWGTLLTEGELATAEVSLSWEEYA